MNQFEFDVYFRKDELLELLNNSEITQLHVIGNFTFIAENSNSITIQAEGYNEVSGKRFTPPVIGCPDHCPIIGKKEV